MRGHQSVFHHPIELHERQRLIANIFGNRIRVGKVIIAADSEGHVGDLDQIFTLQLDWLADSLSIDVGAVGALAIDQPNATGLLGYFSV